MESTPELAAHLTSGAAVVYAIEYAKRLHWLPMTADTKTLNRVISAVLAALTTVGITWSYDPEHGRLIVENLTRAALWGALGHWLQQFLIQQVIFDAAVAPTKVVAHTPASEPEQPVGLNLTR